MKNKSILLTALFCVAVAAGTVLGYNANKVTRVGDLRCTDILLDGNDILDSSGTTRITVGSTVAVTGNLTVSGTFAPTGNTTVSSMTVTNTLTAGNLTVATSTAPRDSSATVGLTPTAAGQIAYNSTDKELCLSTGTTRFTWIEVTTGAVTACRH